MKPQDVYGNKWSLFITKVIVNLIKLGLGLGVGDEGLGSASCLHWLLTWVAYGAHPCRSCMVAPRDYFQDDKETSGILKIIKS